MRLKFFTVDVFTDRRFGGNPLAVFPEAAGLSGEQMQAIATEFNLSETTFVLPPKDAGHTAQVRIFTPRAEMPFAGHPNVGTAYVLAREAENRGAPMSGALTFEEGAGLVRVELLMDGGALAGARLRSPQPFSRIETIDPAVIAETCGIDSGAVVTANHQPLIAGCGVPFTFAELNSLAALAAAAPRTDAFAKHLPADRTTGVHLYVRAAGNGADIQSRMFGPLYGVPEDPATGSANVTLIGLLADLRAEPDLDLALTRSPKASTWAGRA